MVFASQRFWQGFVLESLGISRPTLGTHEQYLKVSLNSGYFVSTKSDTDTDNKLDCNM